MNKQEEKEELYFVYGTLKNGHHNNYILQESKTAKLIETGVTEPKFNLHDLGPFPGVTENGTTSIHGEIWSVSDNDTKRRLDSLEGYNQQNPKLGLYDKKIITVNNKDVNIYLINRDMSNTKKITTGIWE